MSVPFVRKTGLHSRSLPASEEIGEEEKSAAGDDPPALATTHLPGPPSVRASHAYRRNFHPRPTPLCDPPRPIQPSPHSTSRWLLVRRTLCRLNPLLRLHRLSQLGWRSRPRPSGQVRCTHSASPASRRRLEYLRRRPQRTERQRKSLLRPQARRSCFYAALHAGSPRLHPASRRYSADEHVRETLPRVARPVPMEIPPDRPRRDGLLSQVVHLPHLRTFQLEPRDAHASRASQSLQAHAPAPS